MVHLRYDTTEAFDEFANGFLMMQRAIFLGLFNVVLQLSFDIALWEYMHNKPRCFLYHATRKSLRYLRAATARTNASSDTDGRDMSVSLP